MSFAFYANADHKNPGGPPEGKLPPGARAKAPADCEPYRKLFANQRPGFLPDPEAAPEPGPKATPGKHGHSAQGEHFSEGRRRQQSLWENTGRIHFETSTKSEQAQKFFKQGLAQLHGYDRDEAERSFRQALKLDPDYAMAYWGLVVSTGGKRAAGFLKDLQAKLPRLKTEGKVSAREQLWLDAAAALVKSTSKDDEKQVAGPKAAQPGPSTYTKALEAIVKAFPDDIEARALWGHELMQAVSRGAFGEAGENKGPPGPRDPVAELAAEKKTRQQMIAQAELVDKQFKEVLKVEPMHPVHHYRIHLWDFLDPARALDSAQVLGLTAPSIGHMWHMPGHTYSGLGMWREAIWNQMASARVDNDRLVKSKLFPHEHGDYAHNHGWLVENMTYLGMGKEAVAMAKKMIELPTHGARSEGFEKLVGTLRLFGMWEEAIELAATPYLATHSPEMEAQKQLLLGLAYANTGRKKELAVATKALACLRDLQAEQLAALPPPKEGPPAELPPPEVGGGGDEDQSPISVAANHLRTWQLLLDGKRAEAEALFKARPPLMRSSAVSAVDDARLAERFGRVDEAKQILKDNLYAKGVDGNAVGAPYAVPLAMLTELQWKGGEKKAAKQSYKQLVQAMEAVPPANAALAPFQRLLDIPQLSRLGHLAAGAPLVKEDANHPKADKLGPLYWTPPPAPKLVLDDVKGEKLSLEKYKGKAVLVVFNLGTGCPHCNEQLQELIKAGGKFRDANIETLVVTNENAAALKKSFEALSKDEKGKDRTLPFRMAGDPDLNAFRDWEVFADLDNPPQPLHGLYLVDAQGRLRWREVSHNANTRLEDVLEESRRLLRFP